MPTYQYTCTDCGEPVEAVQKFTDDPLSVCAACGGRLRKVLLPGRDRVQGARASTARTAATARSPQTPRRTSRAESAKSGESSNGSKDKADKTAAKKSEPVSTSSKSSGEKVA